MTSTTTRLEQDSMGALEVPTEALWGAQTQRAVQNFPVSGLPLPTAFIQALAMIKGACAAVHRELGLLDEERALAIETAAAAVARGEHATQFPVDVFQSGSGTSSNMNVNEVIAGLARAAGVEVHPNDHVNLGQSSNDVVPSAIHLSASLALHRELLPALAELADTITRRAAEFDGLVKTGRTHLMDALPLRLDQELSAWAAQVRDAAARIESSLPRLCKLALGGTAVGTGLNAHPELGARVVARLASATGVPLTLMENRFAGLSSQDAAVEMSGQLRAAATTLLKICNDLRWMNSGPLAGLAEIQLPALQPGSSIMPGKVNPVIPEAVAMACAQVTGNDLAVTLAGQSGNFQLNVMLPLVAHNLLQSIQLLANGSRLLARQAIAGFTVNEARLAAALDRNPMLVTALNARIGYAQGAAIARQAYAEGRPILDVALECTELDEEELRRLLDPRRLTEG
ncbi:MAG: class II fumarate hydratase, partial [Gammaproteobacteria bacterium]|nr:class II fumarate hydratase [Gammaproteobacteria bacterium]